MALILWFPAHTLGYNFCTSNLICVICLDRRRCKLVLQLVHGLHLTAKSLPEAYAYKPGYVHPPDSCNATGATGSDIDFASCFGSMSKHLEFAAAEAETSIVLTIIAVVVLVGKCESCQVPGAVPALRF